MLGIDAEGIDLRLGDRLLRVPLPRPIGSVAEAREVLVAMAAGRH
jgi:putative heme iron utilization protein